MNLPPLTTPVTVSNLAAALSIATVIGSAILWMLSQRFATTTQLRRVYKRLDDTAAETTDRFSKIEAMIVDTDNKHRLAAIPIEQLGADIGEIKDMLRRKMDDIDRRLTTHGERLASVEARRPRP